MSEHPACPCDLDDPCFCFPELATPRPRYVVRPGAQIIIATATGQVPRYMRGA